MERAFVGRSCGSGPQLVVVYATVRLRPCGSFPYHRPWGESMRGFLWATAKTLGLSAANAVPGLFTVLIIFLIARFLARLIGVWFDAIERGEGHVRGGSIRDGAADAAPAHRASYGCLPSWWRTSSMPSSQTEAFKGVSVFLGLIVTFGSSGIVNQIMSGFTITYSRALRPGDFVRIGDVEGTVIHLGVLSTKVKTLRQEEITIPNAVVVSQTTTDYSRFGDTEGVFMPTSVTIRVRHGVAPGAFPAAARSRADGGSPPRSEADRASGPGFEDFYVKYTLFFCLERQQAKPFSCSARSTRTSGSVQ